MYAVTKCFIGNATKIRIDGIYAVVDGWEDAKRLYESKKESACEPGGGFCCAVFIIGAGCVRWVMEEYERNQNMVCVYGYSPLKDPIYPDGKTLRLKNID